MKKAINRFLSVFLALALALPLMPALQLPAKAADETALSLTLGDATGSGPYYYSNAMVTGSGIKTILLSFSGAVSSGDTITLPTNASSDFKVSSTSEKNDYTKRINIAAGADAAAVQAYIRGISFTLGGTSQSVKVTITTVDVEYDTFYDVDTQHYYQFVPYTSTSQNTKWTDAYNAAESMTYMGRTGYLATVTSLNEDALINSLSNKSVGWLGGTALKNTGTSDSLYYSGFDTADTSGTYWYWACGPEIGDTFYQGRTPDRTHCGGDGSGNENNPYWNWANEPSGGGETCLTTLYLGNSLGVHGTAFSWNDITYDCFNFGGTYSPAGFFVEYGDLKSGSDEAADTRYASVTGSLSKSTTYSASVGGNAMSGQTLTASLTGGSDSDTLAYQWLRDDAEISGATSATYTLTDSDVGHMIAVRITDSGTTVTSPYVGPVAAALSLTLGDATGSGPYYYSNAMVTGSGIKTILLSFSDSVEDGDKITLPTDTSTVTGFTVSTTSAVNGYTKRISIDTATVSGGINDAAAVQNYIRGISFTLDSSHTSQSVKVTITTENVQYDTFYDVDTQHYYQYVQYSGSYGSYGTWMDAYTAAEHMTYMGRTGYLATITSLAEDTFVNSLSGSKVGWLGGTALSNTGESTDSLYYNGFKTDSAVDHWYWACGPERGNEFYASRIGSASADTTTNALGTKPYYNWNYSSGYSQEPNNGNGNATGVNETCLTTLCISGRTGKWDTAFSWNDIPQSNYNTADFAPYIAQGFFVEYGNCKTSDSTTSATGYASVTGSLSSQNYTATVDTKIDGTLTDVTGGVELRLDDLTYSLGKTGTGVYSSSVPTGTYDVYVGGTDTGVNITVSSSGGSAEADYYTVSFSASASGAASGSSVSATAGGSSISSGATVLAGKTVVLSATGAGAGAYTYAWSGDGTTGSNASGQSTKTLTISSLNCKVNASCTVTGSASYSVTVSNGGNGTGTANPAAATKGDTVTLTATPAAGYHFKEWQVVSGGVTVTNNAFIMPAQAVEVKAIFEINTYAATVNVKLDGEASNTPVGTGKVELKQSGTTKATLSGGSGVYTANVVNGAYDVYVNGADTGTDITISGSAADVTIYYYTVTFTASGAAYSSETVKSGGTAAVPGTSPTRSGYCFNGWYADAACKSAFNFATSITNAVSLYAGWKADAPSAPEIDGKTDTTITVKAVEGQEYSIDRTNWQSGSVFGGLNANTTYTVYSRVAASGNDFASDPSRGVTVTTKASAAAAPSAPTVTQQTSDTITINTVKGQQYAITTTDSVPTAWDGAEAASGTKTFSGLNPAKKYYIWTRTAETDTAMPSAASDTVSFTAQTAPTAGTGYSINYGTEKINITAGYEVSADSSFGSTLSDGAAVTPGATYYVRKAADTTTDPDTPASASVSFTLDSRPSMPSVGETGETIDGKNDGKITGASDSMEYKLSSGTVWTSVSSGQASGVIEGLPDGTYNIRYKAVQSGSKFASSVQTITIDAGRKISVTFDSRGGSDVESAADLSYGGHVTKPSNPTKSGYYFAGWYKEPAYSNIWAFDIDTLKDDLTLYAKWDVIPTYTVTGSVVGDADNPQTVQGATVKIIQGVLQFGTTAVTNQNGGFSIENVPAGIYDLIVTKGARTAVIKISVSSGNVAVGKVVLPSANANSDLAVQGNDTPNVVVGGLNTEAVAQFGSGSGGSLNSVKLILTVEKKNEEEAANGKNVTKAVRDAGLTTGMILEVDLSKSVNGGTPAALSESTGLIEIIIPIPEALQNKSTYSVFRYHGTSVDRITQTRNTDNERIEVNRNNWTITLYTRKFSTYSIAYEDYQSISSGVTTSAGNGGIVTLKSGSAYGGSGTYTITPDDGYYISDVIVDGKSVGPVNSYTFSDTAQKHTIQAVFKKISGLPYYTDKNGNKVFIGFASDKSGTMKYIAPEGVTVQFTPNPKNFTDISGHWAKSYIDFVTKREIFVGTAPDVFSPDTGMTRAMFATVIGRLYERSCGTLKVSGPHAFTDCNYDDWYGPYVDWCSENGIIEGVGGRMFEPDREITRVEMAAILYRFAEFMGVSMKDCENTQLTYSDASSISSWAEDAAKYCQQTEIIVGRDNGNFAPQGTATRAEVTAILERFIEIMV